MSQLKSNEKRMGGFWPLAGLLLALCFAVIAYLALADPLILAMSKTQFNPYRTGLTVGTLKIAFSVFVFIVFSGIAAMVIAVATPKSRVYVNEDKLKKEREAMVRAKIDQKKRARRLAKQMREGK